MVASVKFTAAGHAEYLLGLAGTRGDDGYYTSGPEPAGVWFGPGCERLGVTEGGRVEPEDLRRLADGFGPAGEKLVQNAGESDRCAFADFCFSPPKSVSLVWALGDPEIRRGVEASQEAAVKASLTWFAENAAFCRTGRGGVEREKAAPGFALFQHGSNRNLEMQLHTHALLVNGAGHAGGRTGALDMTEARNCKMLMGSIYRAELSYQLEARLSVACERESSWFEVRGVPQCVRAHFSTRRDEILEYLAATGQTTARAAAFANLATRQAKGQVAREVLFGQWAAEGRSVGFGAEQVRSLRGRAPDRDTAREAAAAVVAALEKLTSRQSHFGERELLRAACEEAQGRGLWADRVVREVKAVLEHSPELVRLRPPQGPVRYTTREMFDLEGRLLDAAERSKQSDAHALNPATAAEVLRARPMLNDQQRAAVEHTLLSRGGIKVVTGMAGTGKSAMLEAVREGFEREGRRVIGAALSGKAAEGLEQSSGIRSTSIARLIGSPELGLRGDLDGGAEGGPGRGGGPAAAKTARGAARVTLDGNTVLVIDEAGMVGTRAMERLVREAARAGAKLVLVGDARQLQPIEAGGPFRALAARLGHAELTTIVRQREDWAKEAVHEFARGNAGTALRRYAERGLVQVARDREAALDALVADYARDGLSPAACRGKLAFAGTRLEVAILNERIQAARADGGELGAGLGHGRGALCTGDRVLFTRTSGVLGVKNGTLGAVEAVNPVYREVAVRLDSGASVTVALDHYPHVQLGYATTVHRGQGVTCDRAYALAGGGMTDRELSYVQMSRARDVTGVYVDRLEAGPGLELLARSMAKSRAKNLAHDVGGPEPGRYQAAGPGRDPEHAWEHRL
jgi:conjugative relaxase-like TrwC/TraI family protein